METAERYRVRAQDVRKLAAMMAPGMRTRMLALAEQWETLARQAEYLTRVREELANI
ncbi:MAG: hypothetical protein AB7I36_07090 [Rhodospirillaceae bacterium]